MIILDNLMVIKMKYYQISVSAEPKTIGVNNGVYQVKIDENKIDKEDIKFINFVKWFNYNNNLFWKEQNNIKLLQSPIIKGEILKKAKITDIMGYAPNYHCLFNTYSEKYINIIKTHSIGDYSLFDFEIENVKEKYYLMFIKTITTPEIIFDNSILYTGHKIMNNLKYYSVENYEQFIQLLEREPLIRYEKVAISKEYYGRDIISVQATAEHFYSEKLIDFLLDCGVTGLAVKYNNSIKLEFV
jgi:hypothetical protein